MFLDIAIDYAIDNAIDQPLLELISYPKIYKSFNKLFLTILHPYVLC